MLPLPQLPEPLPELRLGPPVSGKQVFISGRKLRSSWSWRGNNRVRPTQLWLPPNLLESQLGFRHIDQKLEWCGRSHPLVEIPRITLGDEVGLEVAEWILSTGLSLRRNGDVLELTLPRAQLQKLRRGRGATADRLVLDLDAAVLVQRLGKDLHLNLQFNPAQRHNLESLGSVLSCSPMAWCCRARQRA